MNSKSERYKVSESDVNELFKNIPLEELGDESLFNAHVEISPDEVPLYPGRVIYVKGRYLIPVHPDT